MNEHYLRDLAAARLADIYQEVDQDRLGRLAGQQRRSRPSNPAAGPKQTLVYSYGIHYKWLRNMPAVVEEQLRWGNRLWNSLVALWRDYDEVRKPAVWARYPGYAAADQGVRSALAAVSDLKRKVEEEKARQQTRKITGPLPGQLKAAEQALSSARRTLKTARDAAYAAGADGEFADLRRVFNRAVYEDHYPVFCQQGQLYHGTFNDITRQGFGTAVKRVTEARKQAATNADVEWPQLRFHRFDGSGRLTVSIQRSRTIARTPVELADSASGAYRNLLAIPGWVPPEEWERLSRSQRRKRGRVTARMRVGGAGMEGHAEIAEIPIQISRMLPPDAEVVQARLVIKRTGSKRVGTLDVTAHIPSGPPAHPDGPTVALHIGCRREAGGYRAATWQADRPLRIPDKLKHVMIAVGDGSAGKIVAPADWFGRNDRLNRITSARQHDLNAATKDLITWLEAHGPVPPPTRVDPSTGAAEPLPTLMNNNTGTCLPVSASLIRSWIQPRNSGSGIPVSAARRLATLARAWANTPPVGADGTDGAALATRLEAWRVADRLNWDRQGFGSRRLTNHRNDVYAQVARIFARQAGTLLVGDISVAELKTITAQDATLPNEAAKRIGRNRALISPGLLRQQIAQCCQREGIPVVKLPAQNLTRRHLPCGTVNDVDLKQTHHPVCIGCGEHYDVDWNATATMLASVPTA